MSSVGYLIVNLATINLHLYLNHYFVSARQNVKLSGPI